VGPTGGAVGTDAENLATIRIRSPDRPARSQSLYAVSQYLHANSLTSDQDHSNPYHIQFVIHQHPVIRCYTTLVNGNVVKQTKGKLKTNPFSDLFNVTQLTQSHPMSTIRDIMVSAMSSSPTCFFLSGLLTNVLSSSLIQTVSNAKIT
jgi:hypothetical protein